MKPIGIVDKVTDLRAAQRIEEGQRTEHLHVEHGLGQIELGVLLVPHPAEFGLAQQDRHGIRLQEKKKQTKETEKNEPTPTSVADFIAGIGSDLRAPAYFLSGDQVQLVRDELVAWRQLELVGQAGLVPDVELVVADLLQFVGRTVPLFRGVGRRFEFLAHHGDSMEIEGKFNSIQDTHFDFHRY